MKTGTMVAIAAASVAVGLLFGTKRGASIRHGMAEKANDLKDKIARASKNAMEEMADLKESVSKKAKAFEDNARQRVAGALDDGATNLQKMKSQVK